MPRALLITGPTASGKTRLAVTLARQFSGEILSADSRQVYQHLDIGTGKDLDEYGEIPYHLIDIVAPDAPFHLFEYLKRATAALQEMVTRGQLPIICGGTPLYIKSLLDGYDHEGGAPDEAFRKTLESLTLEELTRRLQQTAPPSLFERTDKTQRRRLIRALELAKSGQEIEQVRPPVDHPLILAPYYTRQVIRQRILDRLEARLSPQCQGGLIHEVQQLLEQHLLTPDRLEWLGLEYRFVGRYLKGELSLEEMKQQLYQHICQFAKHQDIWFRNLERSGHIIHWLPDGDQKLAEELVTLWLQGKPLPPPVLQMKEIKYS